MIRCAQCGLRLNDTRPVCARHGPLSPSPAPPSSMAPPALASSADIERGFSAQGYRVQGFLGQGGFGSVYAATRAEDGQRVALKWAGAPTSAAAQALAREAAALGRLSPPCAPRLWGQGVLLERPYLVLEHIASPTLADLLVEAQGPMPLPRFGELALSILRALEGVHAAGLSHRDVKPENIFIRAPDTATLIDFGSAHASDVPGSVDPLVEGVGTAEYMAPEQCDGLSDADPRTDLYSAGIVLYEMLTGAPPFLGTPADVREAQRSQRIPPLSVRVSCPPELEALVRRCLAKERAKRFSSARELADALQQVLAGCVTEPLGRRSGRPEPAQAEAASVRERRTVGLLFFESRAGVGAVQSLVNSCGGQIVQAQGARYVASFGHEVADNPVRTALLAAQRLLAAEQTQRVLVDLASVTVQSRPDGQRRVFSPIFSKADRFPTAKDPLGAVLTKAAAEVLSDVKFAPLDPLSERSRVESFDALSEPTTLGMRSASLVGRDALLSALDLSLRESLAARSPTLVTVLGESGYGKTHLATVFTREVDRQKPPGLEVLRLTARDPSGGTLAQLIARALELRGPAPADAGRALLTQRLGPASGEQVWAAAALALGWIDATHPEVRRLAAAPGALRAAAVRAAGEGLRRRAESGGLMLVVDDADKVEDAALDALEYASLKEGKARIWILALARPSFDKARPAWGTRAARAERLELTQLDAESAAELARRLLAPAEHVPPRAIERLVQRTQGIPFLLVELIWGLKREGFVRRSARGTGYYLATEELEKLPDLPIVQWSARREVDALSPQLAEHARLASVFGASFSAQELEAVLQILERDGMGQESQLDAGVGLSRLVSASVLTRLRNGSYDFRHPLLRDTIYQLLPEVQQKRLHAAVLELYRSLPQPTEQQKALLPRHAARAGDKAGAAAAYLALARRSAEAQAYLEAEVAFGGALENLTPAESRELVATHRGRGQMRFRLGRHEDALADFRAARALAREIGERREELAIALDEATVLDWTRDYAASAELVRMVERAQVRGDELLSAQLSMGLMRIEHRSGNAEASVALGEKAAEQAGALGDAGYETRIIALTMLASDLASSGRLDAAERCFDCVIAEAAARGDFLHLGGAHSNRALLWFARMNAPRLFGDLGEALRIAREAGYPLLEYLATCNLAEAHLAVAELDQASAYTMRSLQLAQQLWGEASIELGTRELLLARIALYRDNLVEAAEWTRQIRKRLDRPRSEQSADVAISAAEYVLLQMVELALAPYDRSAWERFEAQAAAVDLQPLEEVEMLECGAMCALRAGAREAARGSLRRAVELSRHKPNLSSERVARRLLALEEG